ncbi:MULTISPECIES: gas vesicle protein GvpO [unclassified Streptomyces]|uniref:gas vesicle protein GvpO n=1 Tax=unclassified Streptomyces TaxID=2593676 RepID=UPI0004C95597|nr:MULTISPECIES: gas vesicle protein [unclassified Streptomyces]WNO69025.1 gas vesicle protein [Streptomyces sp. AM2-3-1]
MAAGEEDRTERVRRSSSKTPAKKSARKTSTERASSRTSEGETKRTSRRLSAPRAMRYAAEQLQELLGRAPESVSALKPTEEGWQANVEVMELERVPGTTSVMASYRVTLDKEGELVAYERTRRYTRGQIDPRG